MNSKHLQEKCNHIIENALPQTGVPGSRVLALARDGRTILSGSSGHRTLGAEDQPITDDTVFWMASATKVLTALCAIKCVDQGLITLDEDVLPHLPDLEKQQVREGFMTENFKLVPRQGTVTLRKLLTMTAGVSYPVIEQNMAAAASIPLGQEPFMCASKDVWVGPFECQPGTKWAYSSAIDWAGALVEKLSGLSLGDYLQKFICDPCGVTGIKFELTPDMRSRLAGAHFRWPDGSVTARGKILSDDVTAHAGGLGAYSTAQDFAQVLLILVNEGKHPITGKQVIRSELVKEMLRPQLNEEQAAWLEQPTIANQMQVLMPGVEKQWGLGFLLMPRGMYTGRGEGTATWAGFANTHWMVDPKKGVVSLVFAQIIPQEDEKLLLVKDDLERHIYDYLGSQQLPNGPELMEPELARNTDVTVPGS